MEADPSLMLHNSLGEIVRMGGGGKTSDVFGAPPCPRPPVMSPSSAPT